MVARRLTPPLTHPTIPRRITGPGAMGTTVAGTHDCGADGRKHHRDDRPAPILAKSPMLKPPVTGRSSAEINALRFSCAVRPDVFGDGDVSAGCSHRRRSLPKGAMMMPVWAWSRKTCVPIDADGYDWRLEADRMTGFCKQPSEIVARRWVARTSWTRQGLQRDVDLKVHPRRHSRRVSLARERRSL